MRTFFIATALSISTACGTGSKGDSAANAITTDSLALVDAMDAEAEGYQSWSQTDNWIGRIATPGGTHGEAVEIWWNPLAYDTIQAQAGGDMPEGSLIVKEGFNDASGSDLKATTYMWKKDGDWFWVGKSASGNVASAGYGISECADCHAASTNDSVMAETY